MGKIWQITNNSLLHLQHRCELRCPTCGGVRFHAIVVHPQGGEVRQEFDKVEPAMFVASVNLFCGNVMAASADPRLHTRDVEFWTGKAHVPHMHFEALGGGLRKKTCDRIPTERGLKRKIETRLDGVL